MQHSVWDQGTLSQWIKVLETFSIHFHHLLHRLGMNIMRAHSDEQSTMLQPPNVFTQPMEHLMTPT